MRTRQLKNLLPIVLMLAGGISAQAAPQTATIDVKKSAVQWHGRKVTGAHDGTVRLMRGDVTLENGALTGGSFVVDMTTIDNVDVQKPASREKLVKHLKSADFFETDVFSTATFRVTAVEALPAPDKGGPTHTITGDMSIKGLTHPVSFPATVVIGKKEAAAKATLTLDRTLWNVQYGSGKFFQGLGDKLIHDEFTLQLDLKAPL